MTCWDLKAYQEHEIEIRFVLNRLNFCEWHLAVDSLENMDLIFLMDEHRKINDEIIRDFLQVDAGNLSSLLLDSPLNQEQKQAVTAITLSTKTSSPPVLLLGPFGTGKTFTIAHMLRMLVQNTNNRILLCTHSNSAADLYIKEFFHIWYNQDKHPRLKPIRIYYKLRALNTVGEQRCLYFLEHCRENYVSQWRLDYSRDLGASNGTAILPNGRTRSFPRPGCGRSSKLWSNSDHTGNI